MIFTKWWARRVSKWLMSRSPKSKSIRLTQKNTYVFPTRYGFLLLLIILLMSIGATNYQNNIIFLATFTTITLGLISIILTYGNLIGVRFSAHSPEPIFCGQSARLPISLTSHKNHVSLNIGVKDQSLHTVSVSPLAESRVEVTMPYYDRGIHSFSAVRCHTVYPLGFVQAWGWLFFDVKVVVYPEPLAPSEQFSISESLSDEYSSHYKEGGEEFYGLRSYRKGDMMSRIHWKSFAREKGLQTKQFVDYLSEPDIFDYDAFHGEAPEKRLSMLCFLVLQAQVQGDYYGLKLPGVEIKPNLGEEHQAKCLLALASFKS